MEFINKDVDQDDVRYKNVFPEKENYYSQLRKELIPFYMDDQIKQYLFETTKIEQTIDNEKDCFDLIASEDILQIHTGFIKLKKEYKNNKYFGPLSEFKKNYRKFVPLIIGILKTSQVPLITFEALQIYNIIFFDEQSPQNFMKKVSRKNGIIWCVCDFVCSQHLLIVKQATEAFFALFDILYNSLLIARQLKKLFDVYLQRLKQFGDVWLLNSFLYFLIDQDFDEEDPLKFHFRKQVKIHIIDILQSKDIDQIGQYLTTLNGYGFYFFENYFIDKDIIIKLFEFMEFGNHQLHFTIFSLVKKLTGSEEFRELILEQQYFDRINFHHENPVFSNNQQNIHKIVKTVKKFESRGEMGKLISKNKYFLPRLLSCRFIPDQSFFTYQFLYQFVNSDFDVNILLLFAEKGLFYILKDGLLSNKIKEINQSLSIIYDIVAKQRQNWDECQIILEELNRINLESILVELITKSHLKRGFNKGLIYKILNVLEKD